MKVRLSVIHFGCNFPCVLSPCLTLSIGRAYRTLNMKLKTRCDERVWCRHEEGTRCKLSRNTRLVKEAKVSVNNVMIMLYFTSCFTLVMVLELLYFNVHWVMLVSLKIRQPWLTVSCFPTVTLSLLFLTTLSGCLSV